MQHPTHVPSPTETEIDILLEDEAPDAPQPPVHPSSGAIMQISHSQIQVSPVPGRHGHAFTSLEFEHLRQSIHHGDGNDVPVLLQPMPETPEGIKYQIIYGERRWRACRDANAQVRALISTETCPSKNFFTKLRENLCRAPLSPWELGRQVKYALENDLCSSLSEFAREVGCSKSKIAEAVQLASIPHDALVGFQSPNELQYRYAKPLSDAVRAAPTAVIAASTRIRDKGQKLKPREVLARLTQAACLACVRPSNASKKIQLTSQGEDFGQLRMGKSGLVNITLSKPLDAQQSNALIEMLQSFYKQLVLQISHAAKDESK